MRQNRFVVTVDNQVNGDHHTFHLAKLAGEKAAGAPSASTRPPRVVIQDTSPNAGDPMLWEYRGAGVWHVAREFTPAK